MLKNEKNFKIMRKKLQKITKKNEFYKNIFLEYTKKLVYFLNFYTTCTENAILKMALKK